MKKRCQQSVLAVHNPATCGVSLGVALGNKEAVSTSLNWIGKNFLLPSVFQLRTDDSLHSMQAHCRIL